MAKQNPATDPVSAAMSAIESALNLTDDETIEPVVETPSPTDFAKSKAAGPILKPSAPCVRNGAAAAARAGADGRGGDEADDRRDASSQ